MRYHSKMEKIIIPDINRKSVSSPDELIKSVENEYDRKITEVVDKAVSEQRYIILLTGPSAAGKTTSSKKITAELQARGKKVNRISLDNFYKTHDDIPNWVDGSKNFETIDSLDLKYLNYIIGQLKKNGTADFPVFDFTKASRSDKTFKVDFDEQTFLIFEGIHALNPLLSEELNAFKSLKIYVSTHSDFVDENDNVLLRARDLRLIRRLLRDTVKRSASPEVTFDLWEKVCKGESLYIKPFRKLADIHINSSHSYEPLVYKQRLEYAFNMHNITTPEHVEIKQRLQKSLEGFYNLSEALVPDNSLLKEFLP